MSPPEPTVFTEDQETLLSGLQTIRAIADRAQGRLAGMPAADQLRELADDLDLLIGEVAHDILRVGFVGTFSSGKTTLIAALTKNISKPARPKTTLQVETLFPISSEAASSCPLFVLGGSTLKFSVRFSDSAESEDRPPDRFTVAAYSSHIQVARSHRWPGDRDRSVVETYLTVPGLEIPATFIDLPGAASNNESDGAVLGRSLERADCFVFVSSAADRTLDDTELNVLNALRLQFWQRGAPTFFVLSKIGLRQDYNPFDNRVEWERIRDTNNQFILDRFHDPHGNGPDSRFLGMGFLPVESARGIEETLGIRTPLPRDLPSVQELRLKLEVFLRTTAGRSRVAALRRKAEPIRQGMIEAITATTHGHRQPRDELRANISESDRQIISHRTARDRSRVEMERARDETLTRAFHESHSVPLRQFIDSRVDPLIEDIDTNVYGWEETLALRMKNEVDMWMASDSQSPYVLFRSLEPPTVELFGRIISDQTLTSVRFSEAFLSRSTSSDIKAPPELELASVPGGLSAAVVIQGTTAAAALVGAAMVSTIVLAPVGAVLGAMTAYSFWRSRKRAERAADELLTEYRGNLERWGMELFGQWRAYAEGRLNEVISVGLDWIDGAIKKFSQRKDTDAALLANLDARIDDATLSVLDSMAADVLRVDL